MKSHMHRNETPYSIWIKFSKMVVILT